MSKHFDNCRYALLIEMVAVIYISYILFCRFVNHTGEVTFTCRLIHSLPLVMSAIQVFYHDRMAAVAHLIGSDQIPLPEQVF